MDELEHMSRSYQTLQDVIMLSAHEWRHHLTRLQVSLDMLFATHCGNGSTEWERISGNMRTDIAMMRHIAESYLATVVLQQESFIQPQKIRLVEEIIMPLLDQFSGLMTLKQQSVTLDFDPQGLTLRADPLLITILFDNLLVNAIHHGSEASEIEITGRQIDEGMRLSVWNSGGGLNHEEAEKLFQPFVRGKSQVHHNSTGVGLYLVKRIVEAHQGRVWIETAAGSGVRFQFHLPLTSNDVH